MCPVTVSAVAPLPARLTGSCPAAWTASLWNGIWYSLATSASSATGCTVPTSLFADITLISAIAPGSGSIAARSTSGQTMPSPSTGSQRTSASSWLASQAAESRTA